MSLLNDKLRAMIGKQVHYESREPIGRASIRYFAIALDDDNPLYRDEHYARAAGHADIVAPPTFVCETCQTVDAKPDPDGYIGHDWHLPIGNCRLIRAGNDYSFERPVLASDQISAIWTLESIVEKPSSRGGTQLFIQSVARYTDAQGKLVATNRETLVVQPLSSDT